MLFPVSSKEQRVSHLLPTLFDYTKIKVVKVVILPLDQDNELRFKRLDTARVLRVIGVRP